MSVIMLLIHIYISVQLRLWHIMNYDSDDWSAVVSLVTLRRFTTLHSVTCRRCHSQFIWQCRVDVSRLCTVSHVVDVIVNAGDDIELTCHDGTVRDVIFMPDTAHKSSLLVSAGAGDCKICVADCASGTLLRAMPGHAGPFFVFLSLNWLYLFFLYFHRWCIFHRNRIWLASNQVQQLNFTQVNLTELNLTQVNLTQVNLTLVNLTQVNLTQVNLTQVNLTQVNLTIVNFTQVNFTQVWRMYAEMLVDACYSLRSRVFAACVELVHVREWITGQNRSTVGPQSSRCCQRHPKSLARFTR